MNLPYWFWCVRFRTSDGGGETLVVAPHPAGAKQSVTSMVGNIIIYESVEPLGRVPITMADQRFDGYYPGVRSVLAAGRTTFRR